MANCENSMRLDIFPNCDKVSFGEPFGKPVVLGSYVESEIIIGLVGAVGTGMNGVIWNITEKLKNHGYTQTTVIKVSKEFLQPYLKMFASEDLQSELEDNDLKRISALMDTGNWLREKTDYGILALAIAAHISSIRKEGSEPLPKHAFIIDSIKHPAEVEILRKIYGEGFYLVSVYEEKSKRLKNLCEKRHFRSDKSIASEAEKKKYATDLVERDEFEEHEFGQHTRDAFQQADFFIDITRTDCSETLTRFIDLIFCDPFITPTFGEYAMYMAYSASLRSADLSRQVGSVICKNDEILTMGTNDVPKFGGGLYWMELDCNTGEYKDKPDSRDYMVGYDSNKAEFIRLSRDILKRLKVIESDVDADSIEIEDVKDYLNILKKSRLGELTEYGRMVHAEMESLMMCSRGNVSCKDAEMYVTTFPCHNCAKHIIAAGIKKIVYIEPYPKSKTLDFYKDSATQDPDDAEQKVLFSPFFGVGPSRFKELFAMKLNPYPEKIRKDKNTGQKTEYNRNGSSIRAQLLPVSYLDKEKYYLDLYSEYDRILKTEVRNDGKHESE